jgi:hypothetical protein
MRAAANVSLWLAQLRAASPTAWASRSVIAVAGIVALVVPALQPWHQLDLVTIIGVLALMTSVTFPDSAAALFFLVVVTGGWLLRAPSDLSWELVVTAIALLVMHLACAFAGQIPSYAQADPRALRRWLLPAALAIAIDPIVAIASADVRNAAMPGSLLVTVAALTAVTAALWYTSGQSIGSRGSEVAPSPAQATRTSVLLRVGKRDEP